MEFFGTNEICSIRDVDILEKSGYFARTKDDALNSLNCVTCVTYLMSHMLQYGL